MGKLGHWEWDLINDRMVSCSEMLAQIYEMSVDEALAFFSSHDSEIIATHPDDRERYEQHLREMKEKGQGTDIELRIITSSGKVRYIHQRSEKILDNQGQIIGSFGAEQDITERKDMETELRKYQEHLEEEVSKRTDELVTANKDLQAFAHSVSHDLKAPLRSIEGFADILGEEYKKALDEMGHEYLSEISDSAVRMGEMVDDLLAHAEMGQRFTIVTEIDLNTLLEKVKRDLARDIQERDANISIDGKLTTVTGHQAILEALLQNLVSNAIKYVEPQKQPEVTISMSETDEEYIIAVKDNGIGIEKDYQDKIFGIFERLHTREEYPGTGVGLATVEKAVQLHGGRLWLESELDKGTTFHFSITKNLSTSSKTHNLR